MGVQLPWRWLPGERRQRLVTKSANSSGTCGISPARSLARSPSFSPIPSHSLPSSLFSASPCWGIFFFLQHVAEEMVHVMMWMAFYRVRTSMGHWSICLGLLLLAAHRTFHIYFCACLFFPSWCWNFMCVGASAVSEIPLHCRIIESRCFT